MEKIGVDSKRAVAWVSGNSESALHRQFALWLMRKWLELCDLGCPFVTVPFKLFGLCGLIVGGAVAN